MGGNLNSLKNSKTWLHKHKQQKMSDHGDMDKQTLKKHT